MSYVWVTGHALSVTWGGHLFAYGPWLILGMATSMMFVVARPIMTMAASSVRRRILNQHVLLEASAIESADVVLVGNRLSAVADARDIGTNSFKKTKQNLTIAFGFNGIGVPLAVTGLVAPTWAMIAMISSVSIVLANSFATRLSAGLAKDIARFLARSARTAIAKLPPAGLRTWVPRLGTVAVVGFVALGFGAGELFVVGFGAPVVGGL